MSGEISFSSVLMTYSYSNSFQICSFVIQVLLFFVSSAQPVTHVLRHNQAKYWQICVRRVFANVAPKHHALGQRPVRQPMA